MKISGDTTCPNCKKDHQAEFDIDKLEVTQPKIPTVTNVTTSGPQSTVQVEQPKPEVKIINKIPSQIPKYKCKNCKENHVNKEYKGIKYKCSNCGQFSNTKGSCPFCNNEEFEDVDKDELEDLGIPTYEEEESEEEEHEHAD